MRRNNQKGFTLVEILVVCGIIGVMMAVAMPMMFSKAPTWRLKEAARDAYGMFMKCKGEAVTAGLPCVVDFAPPSAEIGADSIAFLDWNGDNNYVKSDNDILVKAVFQWPVGINMDSVTFTGSKVIFLPTAFPAASNGSSFVGGHVLFTNSKGEGRKVVLNRVGSISIQLPSP